MMRHRIALLARRALEKWAEHDRRHHRPSDSRLEIFGPRFPWDKRF